MLKICYIPGACENEWQDGYPRNHPIDSAYFLDIELLLNYHFHQFFRKVEAEVRVWFLRSRIFKEMELEKTLKIPTRV
ncbi:MAG TPA: hypothetical protein VGE97_07820, partial [Nitrososphaera sp.]